MFRNIERFSGKRNLKPSEVIQKRLVFDIGSPNEYLENLKKMLCLSPKAMDF